MKNKKFKLILEVISVMIIAIIIAFFMININYEQSKDKNEYTKFCKENGGVQGNNMDIRYCIINQTIYRMDYSGDKLIIFKYK